MSSPRPFPNQQLLDPAAVAGVDVPSRGKMRTRPHLKNGWGRRSDVVARANCDAVLKPTMGIA